MVDTSLSGKPEWALHAVGQPSANADRHSAECYPLQDVVHFTHISEAFRIFEDKLIRPNPAGLGDLKGVRANVIWLSPNVYSASYYGSIGFRFNWRALRDRKTLHWVQNTESGYRILISEGQQIAGLELYPELGDGGDKGPLYYDSERNQWYYNEPKRGELVFAGTLSLSDCHGVLFASHYDHCVANGSACTDLGVPGSEAGARFMARLIGQEKLTGGSPLCGFFLQDGGLARHVERAWKNLVVYFSKITTAGTVAYSDISASALVTAMLDRFGTGRKANELGLFFRSNKDLELAVRLEAAKAFGIALDKIPDSEDE